MQASRTVERIGARIAEASGLEGCKWEFIVVKDDTMNAFALPGGKVRSGHLEISNQALLAVIPEAHSSIEDVNLMAIDRQLFRS